MKKDFIEIIYEKRKIVIVIFIVLLLSVFLYFYFSKPTNNVVTSQATTTLKLFGPNKITLNKGEEYEEIGYYAIDSNGKIRSEQVVITNNIDTETPGIYTITYKIDGITKTRIVEVLDTEEESEDSDVELTLLGEKVITLRVGDEYQEPGYQAFNSKQEDVSYLVTVSGSVDTSIPGEYTLTYKIDDEEVIRTIVVLDDSLDIQITKTTSESTNSNIILKIKVTGSSFETLVLPNNVIADSNETTYEIKTNGTYKFIAYNTNGKSFAKEVTINEIDTEKPIGSCSATLNINTTNIKVTATDYASGIASYDYYDNGKKILSSKNSFYNYGKQASESVYVIIHDKAGNTTQINCSIIDNRALEPIKPGSGEKIVKQGETDTLKVYITKKSGYYITRIWAYDPYHQLNKFDSPEYGKNLYRPKTLLEKARSKYNLNNQLILGFNASAFYLKDTYDASEVSKYSKYNKTSVGTIVITNGVVIRNAYNKAYKTRFIAGVDKNNKLRVFTDKKASSKAEIEAKKAWANEVIASGIRNTFTHASILIENGKKSNVTTSMPSPSTRKNRQAICQVNDNNFVLITGDNLNRSDLQNIMLSLKCQTGTNLDGGGSIALFFQAKGTNTINTIIGNGRSLTEVAYFSE